MFAICLLSFLCYVCHSLFPNDEFSLVCPLACIQLPALQSRSCIREALLRPHNLLAESLIFARFYRGSGETLRFWRPRPGDHPGGCWIPLRSIGALRETIGFVRVSARPPLRIPLRGRCSSRNSKILARDLRVKTFIFARNSNVFEKL